MSSDGAGERGVSLVAARAAAVLVREGSRGYDGAQTFPRGFLEAAEVTLEREADEQFERAASLVRDQWLRQRDGKDVQEAPLRTAAEQTRRGQAFRRDAQAVRSWLALYAKRAEGS